MADLRLRHPLRRVRHRADLSDAGRRAGLLHPQRLGSARRHRLGSRAARKDPVDPPPRAAPGVRRGDRRQHARDASAAAVRRERAATARRRLRVDARGTRRARTRGRGTRAGSDRAARGTRRVDPTVRSRDDHLHLGHDRRAERRDAHASQHRLQRARLARDARRRGRRTSPSRSSRSATRSSAPSPTAISTTASSSPSPSRWTRSRAICRACSRR